jgi:hypothetical protein
MQLPVSVLRGLLERSEMVQSLGASGPEASSGRAVHEEQRSFMRVRLGVFPGCAPTKC